MTLVEADTTHSHRTLITKLIATQGTPCTSSAPFRESLTATGPQPQEGIPHSHFLSY